MLRKAGYRLLQVGGQNVQEAAVNERAVPVELDDKRMLDPVNHEFRSQDHRDCREKVEQLLVLAPLALELVPVLREELDQREQKVGRQLESLHHIRAHHLYTARD